MSITSKLVRVLFSKGDAKRDRNLQAPDEIERFDDLSYGPCARYHLLDVYRSKGNAEMLPVIINIHGGGWVYGDKEVYQYYCMGLAQYGFAVVNASYRLAPESKFPSQLTDVNDVVKWVLKHAETYQLDTERIFLVGDSAGAHLAALYSCLCTNPDYALRFPSIQIPTSFMPAALVLNCGVYDIEHERKQKRSLISGLMKDLLGKHFDHSDIETVDAIRFITADFPPCFIMTANEDFLNQQSYLLRKQLDSHQVTYQFRDFGSVENPLAHVFHLDLNNTQARACTDQQCDFLKQFCLG